MSDAMSIKVAESALGVLVEMPVMVLLSLIGHLKLEALLKLAKTSYTVATILQDLQHMQARNLKDNANKRASVLIIHAL
ncbi:hypothetical protein DXG01_015774 [Tephrocybe rancida]|nr:hypothetical protein DXG01_015774 [Tephrocybe rancida]